MSFSDCVRSRWSYIKAKEGILCEKMERKSLEQLTGLVLVDILAAVPMEQAIRLMRIGSPRLRKITSWSWITDRMTDVTFRAIVRARIVRGSVATTFCTPRICSRLHGRVVLNAENVQDTAFMKAYRKVAKNLTGNLYL